MNIRNKEGYMDRTPYEAMKAIEKQTTAFRLSPHGIYLLSICWEY